MNIDQLTIRQDLAEPLDDPANLLSKMRGLREDCLERVHASFMADEDATFVHRELAQLSDALIMGALDYADRHQYRLPNPSQSNQFALVAVGGYGRQELAPFSDIDLLFVYPYKCTPYIEQMAEFLLYKLWDMGLKVGHAMRSVDDAIRMAKSDLTIQTSLLESRFLWGTKAVYDELTERFRSEVCQGYEHDFIEAKLRERDQRHKRTGDSRYLLEPNIKEGKGGLRDLHTLVWIGKITYRIEAPRDFVQSGILSAQEWRLFNRSRLFLWKLRCNLHFHANRPEERLTFGLQPKIAQAMGYGDRKTVSGVERFMKMYYLVAKDVGSLTRSVCAFLEMEHKRKPRMTLVRFGLGRRKIGDFEFVGSRINFIDPGLFARRPQAMIELFHEAQQRSLDIHPAAFRAIAPNLRKIDSNLRSDPRANRLMLEILTHPTSIAPVLARMNDAGLLGKFIPEFGRIVALMQYNLYHVYTVDEHTIRMIAILEKIERGEYKETLPLASELLPKLELRTELYIAAFLHDLGKGRGGNHSQIGAKLALGFGKRFGLSDASIDTISWLVEQHLVMSNTAFRRDLDDPRTIDNFCAIVRSPERLRLLLVLTAADICAVGPNVWNGWKGQLLRELYYEAESVLAVANLSGKREARVQKKQDELKTYLEVHNPGGLDSKAIDQYVERLPGSYWSRTSVEQSIKHAQMLVEAEKGDTPFITAFEPDEFRATTRLTLVAADHPGLFMKIAGVLALNDANIVYAQLSTLGHGMVLDTLGFQSASTRGAVVDPVRLKRIESSLMDAFRGEIDLKKAISDRSDFFANRTKVFTVKPSVIVNNKASQLYSVIEINARDRKGLLFDLAFMAMNLGLVIHSAHISTYGERVVDVFYVKDRFGLKIRLGTSSTRIQQKLESIL